MTPKNIVMVRAHSMGVGDVLRSSAAWASIKRKWPDANLHLLFLSRHQGYPTEKLIQSHHALASATFVTIKTAHPGDPRAKNTPWSKLKLEIQKVVDQVKPDLIIDFEPHGLRTTMVTRALKSLSGATTVGIAQFPGRSWFYDLSSPSVRHFMRTHDLTAPMDYTLRDYVALATLGIEREDQAIELNLSPVGEQQRDNLLKVRGKSTSWIGLNIGCGTADALAKRPPLDDLAQGLIRLARRHSIELILTGAPFEKAINEAFIETLQSMIPVGEECPLVIRDLAGTIDLLELAGVISACDVFISSDSGPYHMAVALGLPTLLWLELWEPSSIHRGSTLRHLMKPHVDEFVQALEELLPFAKPPILKSAA